MSSDDIYGELRSILAAESLLHVRASRPGYTAYRRELALGEVLSDITEPELVTQALEYLKLHPKVISKEISFARVLLAEELQRIHIRPEHFKADLYLRGSVEAVFTYTFGDYLTYTVYQKSGSDDWCAEISDIDNRRFSESAYNWREAFKEVTKSYLLYDHQSSLTLFNEWLGQGKPAHMFGVPDRALLDSATKWEDFSCAPDPLWGDQVVLGFTLFTLKRINYEPQWRGDVRVLRHNSTCSTQQSFSNFVDVLKNFAEAQQTMPHVYAGQP